MNLETLKKILLKKYIIEHNFNLNSIESSNDQSIDSCLIMAKKEFFPSNYRIVFYYFKPLKRSFPRLPYDILEELQIKLYEYDIPSCFILIVTNDKTIKDQLFALFKRYNVAELEPMNHMIVNMN